MLLVNGTPEYVYGVVLAYETDLPGNVRSGNERAGCVDYLERVRQAIWSTAVCARIRSNQSSATGFWPYSAIGRASACNKPALYDTEHFKGMNS
jgi:hypothetical protein